MKGRALFLAVSVLATLIGSIAAQTPQNTLAFELVSIRPSASPVSVPGLRSTGGAPTPEGCSNATIQLDPKRLAIHNVTLSMLIAWAHSTERADCRLYSGFDRLSGEPGWVKSEAWDIQAVIPEGTARYTQEQLLAGKAPELQRMLQMLLADRFKLVLRREMKEMPVYLLTLAKDGPKFNGHPARPNGRRIVFQGDDGNAVGEDQAKGVWRSGSNSRDANGFLVTYFEVWNTPIADIVGPLFPFAGRPVLDRTEHKGEANFRIEWLSGERGVGPARGAMVADGGTLSNAFEQIGLKLEDGKAPMEIWAIERIEKPSEN